MSKKITTEDVVAIRKAHSDGLKISALAIVYKLSYEQIRRIVKGERWRKAIQRIKDEVVK